MVQRFSRLGVTVLEPRHLNSMFSHSLTSSSFPCQRTEPSYSPDSVLLLTSISVQRNVTHLVRQHFFIGHLMCVRSYSRCWGYSTEPDRHGIYCVFSLLCFTPGGRTPESHVPKLNILALELSRSWVWKQLKDPLG